MSTVTMSFAQFFKVADPVTDNLSQFYQNIDQANQIANEIQKQIDFNNKILSTPLENFHQSIPQNIPKNIQQLDGKSWLQQFIDRGTYHAPQNTPSTPVFSVDYWSNFLADVIKKALWLLWNSFIGISQWLCIIVAVGGILAYLFGYKKGIAFTGGSIAFYVLLKFITIALGG